MLLNGSWRASHQNTNLDNSQSERNERAHIGSTANLTALYYYCSFSYSREEGNVNKHFCFNFDSVSIHLIEITKVSFLTFVYYSSY